MSACERYVTIHGGEMRCVGVCGSLGRREQFFSPFLFSDSIAKALQIYIC